MQPLDDLIPQNIAIVVLDTSPARNLAYGDESPPWVGTFAEMARHGYSFSLADNAFAELVSQIASGAITKEQVARMLERLQTFLNPSLPILPGKRDIHALIGSSQAPDWSVDQVRALSVQGWNHLNRTTLTREDQQSSADGDLQDEREAWFAIFDKLGDPEYDACEPLNEYKHRQLDIALTCSDKDVPELSPPLSVRWDLQMRLLWRQYVRSKKASKPYDPTSPKKRNDGIDFDLFHYLLLPGLVVATDSGFFEKLADIKSYQKAWFWKPEALAQAWTNGDHPRATWP